MTNNITPAVHYFMPPITWRGTAGSTVVAVAWIVRNPVGSLSIRGRIRLRSSAAEWWERDCEHGAPAVALVLEVALVVAHDGLLTLMLA